MTLKQANEFFENLKMKTTSKSETKVFEKFIYLLQSLMSRNFSENEKESIEVELDSLNFLSNPKIEKKQIQRALNRFEKYLKDSLSLLPSGYYSQRGIGLGSYFGLLFGIIFLSSMERSIGIALGLSLGMLFGLIIGRSMDFQARKSGNML